MQTNRRGPGRSGGTTMLASRLGRGLALLERLAKSSGSSGLQRSGVDDVGERITGPATGRTVRSEGTHHIVVFKSCRSTLSISLRESKTWTYDVPSGQERRCQGGSSGDLGFRAGCICAQALTQSSCTKASPGKNSTECAKDSGSTRTSSGASSFGSSAFWSSS